MSTDDAGKLSRIGMQSPTSISSVAGSPPFVPFPRPMAARMSQADSAVN
jgi:hypothetical protein